MLLISASTIVKKSLQIETTDDCSRHKIYLITIFAWNLRGRRKHGGRLRPLTPALYPENCCQSVLLNLFSRTSHVSVWKGNRAQLAMEAESARTSFWWHCTIHVVTLFCEVIFYLLFSFAVEKDTANYGEGLQIAMFHCQPLTPIFEATFLAADPAVTFFIVANFNCTEKLLRMVSSRECSIFIWIHWNPFSAFKDSFWRDDCSVIRDLGFFFCTLFLLLMKDADFLRNKNLNIIPNATFVQKDSFTFAWHDSGLLPAAKFMYLLGHKRARNIVCNKRHYGRHLLSWWLAFCHKAFSPFQWTATTQLMHLFCKANEGDNLELSSWQLLFVFWVWACLVMSRAVLLFVWKCQTLSTKRCFLSESQWR